MTSVRTMTKKQAAYIQRLLRQRNLSGLEDAQRAFLANPLSAGLTMQQGTRIINSLVRLPLADSLKSIPLAKKASSQMASLPGETWEDIFFLPTSLSSVFAPERVTNSWVRNDTVKVMRVDR